MNPVGTGPHEELAPGLKVWISQDGKGVFGRGKWLLLDAVKREGSLQGAATALGISYRKAWGDLREAERVLGMRFLEHRRGGPEGGSSTLTEEGLLWWKEYARFQTEIEKSVSRAFEKWKERIGA